MKFHETYRENLFYLLSRFLFETQEEVHKIGKFNGVNQRVEIYCYDMTIEKIRGLIYEF